MKDKKVYNQLIFEVIMVINQIFTFGQQPRQLM